MSTAYETKKPDRAQILRDARIAAAADVGSNSQLASALTLANIMSKLCGRRIHVVRWPNGCAAMVDAEPGTTGWEDLLVETYDACLHNRLGPVVLGG